MHLWITSHKHLSIIIIIINEEIIVALSPKTTKTRYKVKKQNREIRLCNEASCMLQPEDRSVVDLTAARGRVCS